MISHEEYNLRRHQHLTTSTPLLADQKADWKDTSTYPQNSPSECLTLSEACAEDGVSVMIQTSEPGICFEEHITCDDTGTVEHTEKDLLAYKCRHCGEITSFASFEDPDDQECPECGNCGFDRCEEV